MTSKIPESLPFSIVRSNPASKLAFLGFIVVFIAAVTLPWWGGRADMRLVVEFCYYLALAQLWNLLAGYGGLVSIGQQAFIGLGGYAFFMMAAFFGVPPLLAIFLSGVVTLLFAIPTAFLVFRLSGAYFAIGTWVVAEVYRLSFAQISTLGGGSGMSLPISVVKSISASKLEREILIYFLALLLAMGVVTALYVLLRSPGD